MLGNRSPLLVERHGDEGGCGKVGVFCAVHVPNLLPRCMHSCRRSLNNVLFYPATQLLIRLVEEGFSQQLAIYTCVVIIDRVAVLLAFHD